MPILIVFVLFLATTRTIVRRSRPRRRRPTRSHVRVVGHQWWWEIRYPDLGIVTANELHVP